MQHLPWERSWVYLAGTSDDVDWTVATPYDTGARHAVALATAARRPAACRDTAAAGMGWGPAAVRTGRNWVPAENRWSSCKDWRRMMILGVEPSASVSHAGSPYSDNHYRHHNQQQHRTLKSVARTWQKDRQTVQQTNKQDPYGLGA